MMNVECPHCHELSEVPESAAGETVRCENPSCHREFVIPGAWAGNVSPVAEASASGAAAAGSRGQGEGGHREQRHPSAVGAPQPPPAQGLRSSIFDVPVGTAAAPQPPAPRPAPVAHGGAAQAAAGGQQAPVASKQQRPAATGEKFNLEAILDSLGAAFSIRKLTLFWICTGAAVLVGQVLSWIADSSTNEQVKIFLYCLAAIIMIGMAGVSAGGVACLMRLERQRQPATLAAGLQFCGQRFVALFFGALIVVLAVIIAASLVNLLIIALMTGEDAAKWIAAILFLPQFAVNLAAIVLLLIAVIVPCAVAVERTGLVGALARFWGCIRHPGQIGRTLVQATVFGTIIMLFMMVYVGVSLGLTMATNGPHGGLMAWMISSSSIESSVTKEAEKGLGSLSGLLAAMEGSAKSAGTKSTDSKKSSSESGPSAPGDWLRRFQIALIALAIMAYPSVYWTLAFARYHEARFLARPPA